MGEEEVVVDAGAVFVMRFRAKIIDVGCLNHFSRVISTIAKLTKTCTLRLTLDKLYFILSDKVANGGVSMWCELNQMNFFDEFQMEGVSAENNEIYLELAPENLSRAFKTAQNAKTVKIKLTNKQCPCLTVAMELSSLSTSSRFVTHDIPVGVIPRKLWNDFREPSVPNFDVIEANLNGEMDLKIETDLVCITTRFKDLGNPPWVSWDDSQNSTPERDPMNMAEARIDIKRLLQLLAGQQVNPTKALCKQSTNRTVCPQMLCGFHHWKLSRRDWTAICQNWAGGWTR
ncbi:checkpoint protein HUS1 isoform 3-T3 [Vipera latastei]